MWRSLDHDPGEVDCTKPDTISEFVCNPPMENKGFVDEYFCKRRYLQDKTQHKLTCGEKAASRRKMGLHK